MAGFLAGCPVHLRSSRPGSHRLAALLVGRGPAWVASRCKKCAPTVPGGGSRLRASRRSPPNPRSTREAPPPPWPARPSGPAHRESRAATQAFRGVPNPSGRECPSRGYGTAVGVAGAGRKNEEPDASVAQGQRNPCNACVRKRPSRGASQSRVAARPSRRSEQWPKRVLGEPGRKDVFDLGTFLALTPTG